MEKTYIMPALQVNEAEIQDMVAVSLQGGKADPEAEVLAKEDTSWDIWGSLDD